MGRKGYPPKWQVQVEKTVQRIKKRSTSRFLKSCDVYECICIFISDHLKKNIFSHGTIGLYYRHLQCFSRWLHDSEHISDIRRLDTSCLRKYFSYLDRERNYRKSSLEGVQTSLVRFFRSMKYRRLIEANPCKDFHISARRDPTNVYILTPFDLMAVLRSVKSHYQYLRLQKRFKPSFLFIHRRDLCILALCIACGLRMYEIAIGVTILTLIVLGGLNPLDKKIHKPQKDNQEQSQGPKE